MDIESKLSEVLRYEPETGLLFWTDKAHKSVTNELEHQIILVT
jgi:hypothetical protein